jgi:DNA polymerase III subunit epsilon
VIGRLPWTAARFLVVDVETTGLDLRRDEIISFGAVPVEDGAIPAGRMLYGLVRPQRAPPAASIEIHGIRPHDLEQAPPPGEALRPLGEALASRELVAHAAWVERGFLVPALRPLGAKVPRTPIDTAQLWRLLCVDRGQDDPGYTPLDELAMKLGLPVHRRHHALGDALTTAQAFLALATMLAARGRDSVRELKAAERRMRTHAVLHGRAMRP